MPQEELTSRSDSVSTENSSASPPEQSEHGGSPPDHSETSSGVHSNSSRESASVSAQSQRRSTSVDDLATDSANKVNSRPSRFDDRFAVTLTDITFYFNLMI